MIVIRGGGGGGGSGSGGCIDKTFLLKVCEGAYRLADKGQGTATTCTTPRLALVLTILQQTITSPPTSVGIIHPIDVIDYIVTIEIMGDRAGDDTLKPVVVNEAYSMAK